MDLDQAIMAMKANLTHIRLNREDELNARNAVSGVGIEQLITELFPGTSVDFARANGHFSNELRKTVRKISNNVRNAKLQWDHADETESERDDSALTLLLRGAQQLTEDASIDALTSGKFAFFPYRDEPGGPVRISVLTGFLHPITDPGNITNVLGLLKVESYQQHGHTFYTVWRFTPALLEEWTGLDDWQKYNDRPPNTSYPQKHAPDRLPVAFRVFTRDAKREPEGLAQAAMPAFKEFVKASVALNAAAERGAFGEHKFLSDWMVDALSGPDGAEKELAKQNLNIGPRQGKVLRSTDDYERLNPIDLSPLETRVANARRALKEELSSYDISGRESSGLQLAEGRNAETQLTTSLCDLLADALTEAITLAAGMDSAIGDGWQATLKPQFAVDIQAERQFLLDAKAQGLPTGTWLRLLQSTGVAISDDEIEKAETQDDQPPPTPAVPTGPLDLQP
ncbi:hypothetical protein [Deinococcus peraridilitoris]|uniref:Phage portal protein, SPP1 Gp6 n=1 Tax=Deinococcus peraridilitoris (strain DSM 19664 / LMG 22246 / CIP 109416 / KR-200) TaxID=937777 RepID=L0A294_DEIPD|nr:hypothetical protein [Deinococcus peraridilitoris]AFZ67564.1 hypothetical protein Deipe_2068 [Deinococcus peraridilitoris DSM 19664]